jgi:murein DD-endopeptidase MepM/ murein hydrolase activator NlpD
MINKARFRQLIDEFFNASDLRVLLFDLDKGVNYDDLAGTSKSEKIIEIITFFENRALLNELVNKCAELRPHLNWHEELSKDIEQKSSQSENTYETNLVLTSSQSTDTEKKNNSKLDNNSSPHSSNTFRNFLVSWQGWITIFGLVLILITVFNQLTKIEPNDTIAKSTTETILSTIASANSTSSAIQATLRAISPNSDTNPSPTELALQTELASLHQEMTASAVDLSTVQPSESEQPSPTITPATITVAKCVEENQLQTSINLEDKTYYEGEFKFEAWPTECRIIDQYFGSLPQYYGQFGLPGNEGVNIRAPIGSKVFAVSSGTVRVVNLAQNSHNYGIYVRIDHIDEFQTIYAHLQEVYVQPGQEVKAGDVIGLAGMTGNSRGTQQLRLVLKRSNYTYKDWPFNLHDPLPFLLPLLDGKLPVARIGLHASADPSISEEEIEAFATVRPDIIKVMSFNDPTALSLLANQHPDATFIVRAYLEFRSIDGVRDISPEQFFNDTKNDVSRTINALGGNRDIVVEIHSEPNLISGGLEGSWSNGAEFAEWWLELLALYREELPDMRFIYPGLSPGGSISGIKIDDIIFLEASREAVLAADGLGVHLYWSAFSSMNQAIDDLDGYVAMFPDKLIWITEASNNRDEEATVKAQQYLTLWQELQTRATVRGVTFFVASANDPAFRDEVWVGTEIPEIIGNR